mgnify:CR=1 FL=1|tara:strand:- start:188 stop:436 length:249 start_codon:yes stop_codon:yes gene_type:complete
MVKLSKSEQALYDHVSKSRREVSVEELAALLYKDQPKPKHRSGSIKAMMRTVMLKTQLMPVPKLIRTTRLGVGSHAKYTVVS